MGFSGPFWAISSSIQFTRGFVSDIVAGTPAAKPRSAKPRRNILGTNQKQTCTSKSKNAGRQIDANLTEQVLEPSLNQCSIPRELPHAQYSFNKVETLHLNSTHASTDTSQTLASTDMTQKQKTTSQPTIDEQAGKTTSQLNACLNSTLTQPMNKNKKLHVVLSAHLRDDRSHTLHALLIMITKIVIRSATNYKMSVQTPVC